MYGQILLIGALILIGTGQALAQAGDDADRNQTTTRYESTDFSRFQPQTALDIVRRVPGFSIDTGQGVRGFGSGAGNVLIDGERPSSKSGGVLEALQRIPANSVAAVEVIRGTAGAGEASGQAVIANVLLHRRQTSGTWKLQMNRSGVRDSIDPRGEISVSTPIGQWATLSRATAFSERLENPGSRTDRDGDGNIVLSQREETPFFHTDLSVSTEAKRSIGRGDLTLTGQMVYHRFDRQTRRLGYEGRLFTNDEPDRLSTFRSRNQFLEGEVSAAYTLPLTEEWSAKILALGTARDFELRNRVRNEVPLGVSAGGSDVRLDERPAEFVARATVAKGGEGKLKPEFGIEAAYNRLDSAFQLSGIGPGDAGMGTVVSSSSVLVEEWRGETFANLIWKLRPRWTTEAGLAVEASQISVSGDAASEQDFVFVKPYGTLLFSPQDGLQIRASVRRNVGQLDFSDFAASAELVEDRLFSGNPRLKPEETTRAGLLVDMRSASLGAASVEVFHEWRQDVLEQIILPSGGVGLGNAGDATVSGVTGNLSLPLSWLVPGGLVEVEGLWQTSSFDDPTTRDGRPLSNLYSPQVSIDFRQDLVERGWSWGVGWERAGQFDQFFVAERSLNDDGMNWSAFVETSQFLSVKARLEGSFLGTRERTRERTFFAGDRNGPITGTQLVRSDIPYVLSFSVERQF